MFLVVCVYTFCVCCVVFVFYMWCVCVCAHARALLGGCVFAVHIVCMLYVQTSSFHEVTSYIRLGFHYIPLALHFNYISYTFTTYF